MSSRSDNNANWEKISAIATVIGLIITVIGFRIVGRHFEIDACTPSNSSYVSSSSSSVSSDEDESTIIIGKDINESDLDGLDVTDNGNYFTFSFGEYMQGSSGEIQPIEWRVLAVNDRKVLVISEKLLDYVPYTRECKKITWENCTLRQWMNNTFLCNAFSKEQQKKIATVTNDNSNYSSSGRNGGNSTQDKIFALSIREANTYFPSNSDRIAYVTNYVYSRGNAHKDYSSWWWLRSPGSENNYATDVRSNGHTDIDGYDVDCLSVAVRPAMWIYL